VRSFRRRMNGRWLHALARLLRTVSRDELPRGDSQGTGQFVSHSEVLVRSSPSVSLVLAVVAAIACSDTPSAPDRVAPAEAAPQFLAARQRPPAIGPEVQRHKLAKAVPGFGGYFYDRAGNMHVYLTDLKQSHRARARLQPLLRARPSDYITEPDGTPRIILHQGRYDFPQLAAWRDLLRQHIMGKPNIVSRHRHQG
jgi:hypothetical protein